MANTAFANTAFNAVFSASSPSLMLDIGNSGPASMSIIALTAMAQALVADAITPPLVLEASMMQAMPSAAARAISVETVTRLPTKPVTVTVECLVRTSGMLGDCIPAEDGGTGDLKTFRQRLFATGRGAPIDPVLAAAMARTRFYRVRPPGPAKDNVYRSVLIRMTVSPADKAPSAPRSRVLPAVT